MYKWFSDWRLVMIADFPYFHLLRNMSFLRLGWIDNASSGSYFTDFYIHIINL